jgi:hypothetical protein
MPLDLAGDMDDHRFSGGFFGMKGDTSLQNSAYPVKPLRRLGELSRETAFDGLRDKPALGVNGLEGPGENGLEGPSNGIGDDAPNLAGDTERDTLL